MDNHISSVQTKESLLDKIFVTVEPSLTVTLTVEPSVVIPDA